MQINLDPSSIAKAVDGNKTYITVAVGAAIIALNHFGLVPPDMVPQGLDPGHWIQDEYTLLMAAVFRSAIAKTTPPKAADQQKPQG